MRKAIAVIVLLLALVYLSIACYGVVAFPSGTVEPLWFIISFWGPLALMFAGVFLFIIFGIYLVLKDWAKE